MRRQARRRRSAKKKYMPLVVAAGGILVIILLFIAYDYVQRLRASSNANQRLDRIEKILDEGDYVKAYSQLNRLFSHVRLAKFSGLSRRYHEAGRHAGQLRKEAADELLKELDQLCEKGDLAPVTFTLAEKAVYEFDSFGPPDEMLSSKYSKALKLQAKVTNGGERALVAGRIEGNVALVMGDGVMGLPMGQRATDVSLDVPLCVGPGRTEDVPISVPLSRGMVLGKAVSYTAKLKLIEALVMSADEKDAKRFVSLAKKYEKIGKPALMAEKLELPARYKAYLAGCRKMLWGPDSGTRDK